MLVVLGTAMLAAAVLPFVVLLRIREPYATACMAARLIMLPLGAMCLLGAMFFATRVRR